MPPRRVISLILILPIQSLAALPAQETKIVESIGALQDANQRTAALEVLRAHGADAVPLLLDHIANSELSDRGSLSKALIELGPAALPSWRAAIVDGPAYRRYHAIRATEYLPDGDSRRATLVDAMVSVLGDDDASVSYIAGYTLGAGRDQAVVEPLERRLQLQGLDARTLVRTGLVIGEVRNDPRMPWAVRIGGMDDDNSGFRFMAFSQLMADGTHELELWRKALRDPHRWLRDAAVRTIGFLDEENRDAGRDELIKMLLRPPAHDWNVDTAEEWRLHTVVPERVVVLGEAALPVLEVALSRGLPNDVEARRACETFYVAALDAAAQLGGDAAPLTELVLEQLRRQDAPASTLASAARAVTAIASEQQGATIVSAAADVLDRLPEIDDATSRAELTAAVCAALTRAADTGDAGVATAKLQRIAAGEVGACAAVAALLRLGGPTDAAHRDTARLLRNVSVSETSGHDELCHALGELGAGAARHVDSVLRIAKDENAALEARQAAALAAGEIAGAMRTDDPAGADRVFESLFGVDSQRFWSANRGAALAKPDIAIELLHREGLGAREQRLLMACAAEDPVQLVPYLADRDPTVRGRAAAGLKQPRPAAVPALLELCERDDLPDPALVIRCLIDCDAGARALPALRRFFSEPGLRPNVVGALRRVGAPAAPTVRSLLALDTVGVLVSCFRDLGPAAAAAVPDLAALADTTHDNAKVLAIGASLAFIGIPGFGALSDLPLQEAEHDAMMLQAMRNGIPPVNLQAAQALASRGARIPGQAEKIRLPEKDEASYGSWILALAILDPESPRAVGLLLEGLALRSPGLRRQAIRLLAESAGAADRDRIDAYLRLAELDPEAGVRAAATAARQRLAGK